MPNAIVTVNSAMMIFLICFFSTFFRCLISAVAFTATDMRPK
jgi:hypothetical protein